MTWEQWWTTRGHPAEHDPGPPLNRSWARLFAEVPNYRALGKAVTGREVFRWHFGPMFYRGRLDDGEVKVLVVGQEGAQDESLAHRSFTGGTGARMQHMLGHVGIARSYLFLNTFCYPIYGQYGDHLRWLAQDPRSPIVAHRHDLFDYVVARNDLQLVIAVGTAAKESVATWLNGHGVDASPGNLAKSDPSAISSGLRAIGVLHPGGATGAGAAAVRANFKAAIEQIDRWRRARSGWLPPDAGAEARPSSDYRYSSAALPFGDFPFGTTWRLGRGGTSSNRKDGQRSIQLFSAAGRYNGAGDDPRYLEDGSGSNAGYADDTGDLPYEPARRTYRQYDPGPGPEIAGLLTPSWPTMAGAVGHPSLGFGPIYRGRLAAVTMLILADQGCHDDLFTGRALTGEDGQRLQRWMAAAGIDHSYLILRVPPFDATGASEARRRAWLEDDRTVDAYRTIVEAVEADSPSLTITVTIGPLARRLATLLGRVVDAELAVPSARSVPSQWNSALAGLAARRYRRDISRPSLVYDGKRGQIPRGDLPFGTPRWVGTSGDRAVQGRVGGRPSGNYYKLYLPKWVFGLEPVPLSEAERRAVADA